MNISVAVEILLEEGRDVLGDFVLDDLIAENIQPAHYLVKFSAIEQIVKLIVETAFDLESAIQTRLILSIEEPAILTTFDHCNHLNSKYQGV